MADAKNDIVLSIRGMSKSFGRNRVLDHIDLDVRRGTVMGLMGENGSRQVDDDEVPFRHLPEGRGEDLSKRQ